MAEEELNRKQIRFNRWCIFIGLVLVAVCIAMAVLKDNDNWALGGCR